MKITGFRALVLAPRENHLQEDLDRRASRTRQNAVVIIQTDEGIEGIVSTVANHARQFAQLWAGAREHIEGQDPFDRGKLATLLHRRFHWPQRVLGVLDYGLWDIAGKALNQPIYKLLGATRERVRAYGSTIHHDSDERFIEAVLACRERGFSAAKLHPYGKIEDDLRLVFKVRKAVGDDMRLMIDTIAYPAPYTRDEALRMGRALDELGFWWFEDPLPKTDLDGLADLTRACRVVQIRMGDRVDDIAEYAAMIRHRCVDIIAGPPGFGITELLKLAAIAEAHNMPMEPHDFGGGTASLHVLLAITNGDYYEQALPDGCFDSVIYPGVYEDSLRAGKDGYVEAPTKPGLGFGINIQEAEKVTVERY
jgi:L-alanine-DL-glutamate epimerase-like enolase superfamily enzyme